MKWLPGRVRYQVLNQKRHAPKRSARQQRAGTLAGTIDVRWITALTRRVHGVKPRRRRLGQLQCATSPSIPASPAPSRRALAAPPHPSSDPSPRMLMTRQVSAKPNDRRISSQRAGNLKPPCPTLLARPEKERTGSGRLAADQRAKPSANADSRADDNRYRTLGPREGSGR